MLAVVGLSTGIAPPGSGVHAPAAASALVMPSESSTPHSCTLQPNPSPLDFGSFCSAAGCWPAMWLLGAQKAATTSTADLLESCSIAAYAYATQAGVLPCGADSSCKETHAFGADACSQGDSWSAACGIYNNSTATFTSVYDPRSCTNRVGVYPGRPEQAACIAGRFIEASPSIGDPTLPARLARLMPEPLRAQARFALLLREPVERLLSMYNHIHNPMGTEVIPANTTFDAFALDPAFEYLGIKHEGYYADWISKFEQAGWSRKQMLILSFHALVNDTDTSMRQLTTHFGGPVLTSSSGLPEDNTQAFAGKVVTIGCATRSALAAHYAPHNERLYAHLTAGREKRLAPAVEPPFPPFQLSAPCADGVVAI